MRHFINQSSLQICWDNFRSNYSEKIFCFNICIAVAHFIFQIFLPYPLCLKWHSHKPKPGDNRQITYFLQHTAVELLNMKQAQSEPPPKASAPQAPSCPCPLQCALPQAVPLLSPGCLGVQTRRSSRASWGPEPSSTHIKTTPMTFPTSSMRWQWQSWPRPATQHLWKREEHFTLTVLMSLSLGIFLVSGSWFLSWAIDEDKDPWKVPCNEWESCSFHSHCLFNSTNFLGMDVRFLNP